MVRLTSPRMLGFSTALLFLIGSVAATAQDGFKDIPPDHWAYQAVTWAQQVRIVTGGPDGYFRGNRSFNRYEEAIALARVMEATWTAPGEAPSYPGGTSEFPKDVDQGDPAYQAVITVLEHGILRPYPDGYFRGKRTITRYELVETFYRFLKPYLSKIPIQRSGGPKDVAHFKKHPDYQAVIALYSRNLLILTDVKDYFDGDQPATRYQLAEIAFNSLNSLPKPDGKPQ